MPLSLRWSRPRCQPVWKERRASYSIESDRSFHCLSVVAFANLWADAPLVMDKLESSPATNAMVRTTTAATIFQAAQRIMCSLTHAGPSFNFRAGDSTPASGIMSSESSMIRVEVTKVGRFSAEPSVVSSTYLKVSEHWNERFGVLIPRLSSPRVVVVTDSRYYAA